MAIFHLTHGFVRRSDGSSSIARAAYNSGKKLEDRQGSSAHTDYSRKGGVLFDEIGLPTGSPSWADNRGELWRRLEAREDRSTRPGQAILAHSFNIALPHELTLEQNIFLARDFVREQFTRKGYAADWAIHAADPRGDSRNIHLHILVPLRRIEGESFGNKDRYTRGALSQQVTAWRKSWATLTNRHLKRYGHGGRIDERSLKAQGVARRPTRHRGPQPRARRAALNVLRARHPQPRSPVMRFSKQTGMGGKITMRAVIADSALTKISTGALRPVFPKEPGKGWPEAAMRDWASWGHRNPRKFFTLWRELAPPGFNPERSLNHVH
ncbi:MAG: MobA/MobL family protein [Alphaproteobacteria bacterium]